MRWANEDAYDSHIRYAMQSAGLSSTLLPIVKAIVGVESGFVPTAIRQEPSYTCTRTGVVGDASRGLMQVLFCTALGMGFSGTAQEMFDPVTNLTLGTSYLRDRLQAKGGDVWAAVSAYNNGHGNRASSSTQVCLARGAGGSCQQWFTAQPGQFLNQPYVDKVHDAATYFAALDPGTGGAQPLPPVVVIGRPDPSPWLIAAAVVAGVVVLDAMSS